MIIIRCHQCNSEITSSGCYSHGIQSALEKGWIQYESKIFCSKHCKDFYSAHKLLRKIYNKYSGKTITDYINELLDRNEELVRKNLLLNEEVEQYNESKRINRIKLPGIIKKYVLNNAKILRKDFIKILLMYVKDGDINIENALKLICELFDIKK